MSLLSSGLDRTASGKAHKGTLPARCDDSDASEFPEKNGGWCYANCAEGQEAFGAKCWTECRGGFSADSPLICGRDPKVLAATVTEMVVVSVRSAFTLASVPQNVVGLGSTIKVFVDMGRAFALPKCSEVEM